MKARQAYEIERLLTALDKAEATLLEPRQPCNKRRYLISEYNRQLFHRSLKRTNLKVVRSRKSVWDEIRLIATCCDTTSNEIKKIKCVRGCYECPANEFRDTLLTIVTNSQRDCEGLCLQCVQTETKIQFGTKCSHKFKT